MSRKKKEPTPPIVLSGQMAYLYEVDYTNDSTGSVMRVKVVMPSKDKEPTFITPRGKTLDRNEMNEIENAVYRHNTIRPS